MTTDRGLPSRRSIRLPHYDYSSPGMYFVTVCAWQRECLFGDIAAGEMELNAWGEIVRREWLLSATIRPEIQLDEFIVMPNHVHGIVELQVSDEASHHTRGTAGGSSPAGLNQPFHRKGRSLSSFVAGFKAATTRRINEARRTPGSPVWQRNYYEHVIRNTESLEKIREYVIYNATRWDMDQLHPNNPSRW